MFILAIITIALIGASQSDHKQEESAKIVTEKAIEICETEGPNKLCKLEYK